MKIKNYINGEFVNPILDNWIDNYNPSNGEIYSQIPNSSDIDLKNAFKAAKNAFPKWSETTLEKRSQILYNIAHLITKKLPELAAAEAKDNGKPLELAKSIDIPRAAANFQFFANAITQFASETHDSVGLNAINFTLRQPIGVVGCISPWNLPLYLFTWKIAPAIAAGNCVVAKPSEITPMTAFLLGEILNEAGLPKGVLNIVHGSGKTIGEAIVAHPEIKAISFTGGTQTGAHIAKVAAPMFKKLSLELGGKNPAEASIYQKFKTDFITAVSKLKVGNPFDSTSDLGALVSKPHLEKVRSYIDNAEQYGGKVIFGGNSVSVQNFESGYYLEPTIIEVKDNACVLNQEEIFGPVVTMMPFNSEDEVLAKANDSSYGLSATLWTNDLKKTMRISRQIHTGIVWVNTWLLRDLRTPFGGMKNSGVGREGGFEALRFFTEPKNICIKYN
jgi:aminomuconate-semialdehyde/2-hydroxymuconate-6-semialdehyde dehydrogenase